MELISLYLYNTCPIQTENIMSISFSVLKNVGFSEDNRRPKNFFLLKKIYKIQDKHYKVFLRFSKHQEQNNIYDLDYPVPFMIVKTKPIFSSSEENTELEKFNNENSTVTYEDEKIYHSNQHKKIYDYIKSGLPIDLFNTLFDDLKNNIIYN